jgi:hypothetical protein
MQAIQRIVLRQSLRSVAPLYVQPMATFSDKLKDKGSGDEKIFFNKEDERALKKLLKKVKGQSSQVESTSSIETAEKELLKLIKEHNIKSNSTLVGDLLQWKYE